MHQGRESRKAVAPSSRNRVPALVALVVANLALAFGPWFVRLADTGPVAAGFWRLVLALPLLAIGSAASGWRPRGLTTGMIAAFLFGGLCFAADLGAWHIGILRTTLANATLFGNSATFIYPVYGFLMARAWPNRAQGIALAMATVGAALLLGRSYALDARHLAGDLFCLAAGILYTLYLVCMRHLRNVLPPIPALALATAAGIAPLLLLALAMGERIMPHGWAPLIGLALCSQVIGQGLMIYALGALSPLLVGIALLIQPIVAGAVGWIVYREQPGLADWIGAALVCIALVLVRRERTEPAQRLAPAAGEGQ